ncbi:hypothetical protein [Chengkuizengella axinellae]|uniref:Uncharacterized protein n=1 Tax=Chengkuizengella axinellae TaxID=3064388 RepID=A0ABT9IYE4_9BACL|nr:hypothetical protein [Chengkuizengella sp. 2205SS18-9]MDP5274373.1 hypothetical protein [Chengkuizengella sp. 2205SS18-9]
MTQQLRTLLTSSSNISIKSVVAIKYPYWRKPLIMLPREFNMNRKSITMNMIQTFLDNGKLSIRDIMQMTYQEINDKQDVVSINHFLDVFEKIVVLPPESFSEDDYYTVKDLCYILISSEENIVRRLERGEFKGSFITKDGQWLKPK